VRAPRNVRKLDDIEQGHARDVFRSSIPLNKIFVTDGLGAGDRKFTMAVPFGDDYEWVKWAWPIGGSAVLRIKSLLGSEPQARYFLHVGDEYRGMGYSSDSLNLLIHELVHVWQGEHARLKWTFMIESGWHQFKNDKLGGPDPYEYDPDKLETSKWNDYNVEQQASIVEHWYEKGKSLDDPRYRFIVENIRGEQMRPYVKPLPAATLKVVVSGYYDPDVELVPILAQRFRLEDEKGWRGRLKKLEEFFSKMGPNGATTMLARLTVRKRGDKASEYFHDHLATAERQRFLVLLRKRSAA
jgi:hypothetical protein